VTLTRPNLFRLATVALAFLTVAAVLALVDRDGGVDVGAGGAAGSRAAGRSTDDRIRSLQEAVRERRDDPRGYAALAGAYLQKARETADPAWYGKAGALLRRALRIDPRSADALVALGTLDLARHDFRAGLRHGLAARRAAPELVAPYGVIVDGLVELGRYDAAARALQRMVDLKPNLASYARVSYFRELHGDLDGALRAMKLAVAAGGEAPENVAYVQSLLGGLEYQRGNLPAARRAYLEALERFPGHAPSTAGLARVEAADSDLRGAIRRWRGLVARLPLPEYVIGLGEAELAAGRRADAKRDLALVRAEQRLLAAGGVNTDAEIALFEADHGSPHRAVVLGRRALRAAPSVRSEDALAWALTSAGRPEEGLAQARRALRLGWRDPLVLYHAGMTARAAGEPALARRWLSAALERNPRFSPLYGPRAERALEALR
jgi:tetratricopeptide (TPR) repeat protein